MKHYGIGGQGWSRFVHLGQSRWTALLGLLAMCTTVPAWAVFQNDQIGFDATHVFANSSAGENIDVMNGNLNLTIPIGPHYLLNDAFGYQLQLSYNSKVWDHDCELVPSNQSCAGTWAVPDTYGLGVFAWFGRIYHYPKDKPYVWRYQRQDGSEHFFCNMSLPAAGDDPDCASHSQDADRIHILAYHDNSYPGKINKWVAEPTDGTRVEFTQFDSTQSDDTRRVFYATRVETREAHGNPATAVQFFNISYRGTSSVDVPRMSQIQDSQGRTITFSYATAGATTTIGIDFPAFMAQQTPSPNSISHYALTLQYKTGFSDPAPGVTATSSANVLTSIAYPGLLAAEKYEFAYNRGTDIAYGYLLQRKLPTGAVVDYFYSHYNSSPSRVAHAELALKKLTANNHAYRWSYTRFGSDAIRAETDLIWYNFAGNQFYGSNPSRVRVLDPFDNLTDYRFRSSYYDANCGRNAGECVNNWYDGLLEQVATYAGPNADDAHLVSRTFYDWTYDGSMFKYRNEQTRVHPLETAFVVPVRPRVAATTVFTPGGGEFPPTTRKTILSDWVNGVRARRSDEYDGDTLFRTTITDYSAFGITPDVHKYVETRDGQGNVLSHVDRHFSLARMDCEVRRLTTGVADARVGLDDCTDGELHLDPGDVAVRNTMNAETGTLDKIEVMNGTDPEPQTTLLTYGAGGYLETKNLGFSWKAVDRLVDFNSGLVFQSHDPTGDTMRYTWDGLGRLTKIEPTLPERPTNIYYTNLHETKVRQELSATNFVETVYLYDDLGRNYQVKRRNLGGSYDVQDTEYDVAGRVTRKSEWYAESDAPSSVKWTVYDYTAWSDPDALPGRPSKYPDPLGRIHGVTTPDDLTPDTPTVETTYQGLATTVTVRDLRGYASGTGSSLVSTTTYVKDAFGRLVSVDAPGTGADAAYRYDGLDNLVEVRLTDPIDSSRVQLRRFEYDRLGRLRLAANPENGTVEYTAYDARGNLLGYRDAKLNEFVMTYDDADRLLTRAQRFKEGDQLLVQNLYDEIPGQSAPGHLIQQDSYQIDNGSSSLVSSVRFVFGAPDSSFACGLGTLQPTDPSYYGGLNGRLNVQSTTIMPLSTPLMTYYCQDALGMPVLTGYPNSLYSGRTTTNLGSTFRNGYLAELHDEGRNLQYAKSITYAPGGVPFDVLRGNNERDTTELDVRHRPLRMYSVGRLSPPVPPTEDPEIRPGCGVAPPGSAPPMLPWESCGDPPPEWTEVPLWDSGTYTYDMAGNVKTIGSEQYYYDELSRLVHASVPSAGATHTLEFGFDPFGNMTYQNRQSSGPVTYTSSRAYGVDWHTNRLADQDSIVNNVETSGQYNYDENGNMTVDGTRGYVFDAQNHLREVTDPTRGTIATYDYDASGFRVRAEADGNETFYVRDASGQVLSEFQRPKYTSEDPVWNKDYVYLFGNSFALTKNDLPAPPKGLRVYPVTATSLTLLWDVAAEPDILGYSLERRYRAMGGSAGEQVSYFSLPASPPHWNDTFENPKGTASLKYTLRVVDTAGNLSEPSLTLVVYPGKSDPPKPPEEIIATSSGQSISLWWSDVEAEHDDLAGYYVERQSDLTWDRLTPLPIMATHFLDVASTYNNESCFRVRTVDTSGRVSVPSDTACATPMDTVPPGHLWNVSAEPDFAAGAIKVSWKRGVDADISEYRVYRSTVPGDNGGPVNTIEVTGATDDYSWTNTGLASPATYYYSVIAADLAGNESEMSNQAAARTRSSTLGVPSLTSALFGIDEHGTTATTECPYPPVENCCHFSAESDDVIKVHLVWSASSGASGYHVYRKASTEDRYKMIADVSPGTTYDDTSVTGGHYAYFVVGRQGSGLNPDESAASAQVTADDPFPTTFADAPFVRNLMLYDGRLEFQTANEKSRIAYLHWSRVTESDLVGYNVYRRCDPAACPENEFPSAEHFACEPVWTRLNLAPITPDLRLFTDGDLGGLAGCYEYAVRPVGPEFAEGKISKILTAYLGIDSSSDDPDLNFHCVAALNIHLDNAALSSKTAEEVLNSDPNAINQIQRTAATTGPPPVPTGVTISLVEKAASLWNYAHPTEMASVSWTMANLPKDLAGYYVDVARSSAGPWTRASRNLVAWWETHYTLQGAGFWRNGGYAGQTDCLSFRVIAVDESGNESAPATATYNPAGLNCSRTPDAPQNLRASTVGTHTWGNDVKLEWDGVSGATEYSVYRLIFQARYTYFYETQRQAAVGGAGTTQSFVEGGDWTESDSNPNYYCPYLPISNPPASCAVKGLEVYYVTARGAPKGESPRSNLVFWDSSATPGYARLEPVQGADTDELLASLADAGAAGPYCLAAPASSESAENAFRSGGDGLSADALSSTLVALSTAEHGGGQLASTRAVAPTLESTRARERQVSTREQMSVTPMICLGSLADPPWTVFNLHTDHLGSVRSVTDTITGSNSRHDYFPFGEEITPQFSYNTHQYTGHERDSASGLDYMRARYFSAGVLRFISPDRVSADPIDPQGWNLYEYAGNSPMVFVDDSGWAKRIAISSQYTLILSPGMRDSSGKIVELPHGHFVKNGTGEGAGKIRINGEFEPGAARAPGKALISAGLKAVIKRFGVAMVLAAVVDSEAAAGSFTHLSPIGDDPLVLWREQLEGMEKLGYQVDWRFVPLPQGGFVDPTEPTPEVSTTTCWGTGDACGSLVGGDSSNSGGTGDPNKDNKYGLDPDGPLGPATNPCDKLGPMCR